MHRKLRKKIFTKQKFLNREAPCKNLHAGDSWSVQSLSVMEHGTSQGTFCCPLIGPKWRRKKRKTYFFFTKNDVDDSGKSPIIKATLKREVPPPLSICKRALKTIFLLFFFMVKESRTYCLPLKISRIKKNTFILFFQKIKKIYIYFSYMSI